MADKDSSSIQEASFGVVGTRSDLEAVLSSGKSAKDDRAARKMRKEKEVKEAEEAKKEENNK
ncbi:hypothetical protein Vi05172_g3085 [Venturia inaequalis]|nr:hypothetical protein Vi05172_g3085 [Venturia inaequalis]